MPRPSSSTTPMSIRPQSFSASASTATPVRSASRRPAFLVHENVYERFLEGFLAVAKNIKVGNGLDEGTNMGPLAHDRRIPAMETLVADARAKGAEIALGGERLNSKGYFFQPTVITNLPSDARILSEEPFGPLAPMIPVPRYGSDDRGSQPPFPYGLAAYAFTSAAETRALLAKKVEAGMLTIKPPRPRPSGNPLRRHQGFRPGL